MKLELGRCASSAAVGALSILGTNEAMAQERIWFIDSDVSGERLGWTDVGPDVDGDGVRELLLSATFGGCTQPNQGWVAVHSVTTGELFRWCGTGASTAFGGGVWVDDVDGLGFRDVMISEAGYYDPVQWGSGTGRVQIYSFETSQLLYEIVGTQTNAFFGSPSAPIDDVDGDSIDDLLVGSPMQGANGNGALFVYSGASGLLIRRHDGGFQHHLGIRIGALGDADGDGVSDYAGSAEYRPQGRVLAFSGRTGKKLAQLDGIVGASDDAFGTSISSGGDLDGDGLDDLLISGAFPLSGKWGNLRDGRVEAWSVATQSLIWSITGSNGEWFGEVLRGIGDVNGDGFREFLVTAGWDDHDGRDVGRVDLVSGRTHRSLYRFYAGIKQLTSYGEVLVPGVDFNGDGLEDLVIGTFYGGSNTSEGGHATIYAGNDLWLQADPQVPIVGDTVVIDLRGGEPGLLGLLSLIDVNGTPLFAPIFLAPFDANGELQLSADIDPSVSGMDFTLMAWAQNRKGRGPLMDATPVVVSVQ